jgi:hypothetical protein
MDKQFVVTGGVPHTYGPRITLEWTFETNALHEKLSELSVWNGHDASYKHRQTGNQWRSYEFSWLSDEDSATMAATAARVFGFEEPGPDKTIRHVLKLLEEAGYQKVEGREEVYEVAQHWESR